MSEPPWVPRRLRGTLGEREYHETLYEGAPAHLRPSLRNWAIKTIQLRPESLSSLERALRWDLHAVPGVQPMETLDELWNANGENLLDTTDFLLAYLHRLDTAGGAGREIGRRSYVGSHTDPEARQAVVDLAVILNEAGSAWEIKADGRWRLQRRVDPTTQQMVDDVVDAGTGASQEMALGWADAFGRQPQPAKAYGHAVLALESVACALFTPNDSRPSLGKAIAHLRDSGDRYTVAGLDGGRESSGTALLGMLQMIWANHARHIGADGLSPQPTTEAEAQAAITLAAAIVHWFQRGFVRRREG